MEHQILSIDIVDNIATMTINRPEALNALNSQFFDEFEVILERVRKDDKISVLIITGNGKAFVAGADISEMKNMSPQEAERFSMRGQTCFRQLEHLSIPIIAAINGYALGGGMELAMACDIRLASTNAVFGQPEVKLGLIPGFAGTQRLPRIVGPGNALMMLLSGDSIDANEAKSIGLIQKISSPDDLMQETINLAKKIARQGPQAIKMVKKICLEGIDVSFEDASRLESQNFGSLFGPDSEGEEGMNAFLEKRKPVWK